MNAKTYWKPPFENKSYIVTESIGRSNPGFGLGQEERCWVSRGRSARGLFEPL